jgi:hypothetical protein
MKLTSLIFSILIIAALVWTGCSKSENHAPTSIKTNETNHTNTGSIKAMHAVDATEHDNAIKLLPDSTPSLPLPVYYVGLCSSAGECQDQFIRTMTIDTIIIKWISSDSLYIGKIYAPNCDHQTIHNVFYAGVHVSPGQQLPTSFETKCRKNDIWVTFHRDSLNLKGSFYCSCLEWIDLDFNGVKTEVQLYE